MDFIPSQAFATTVDLAGVFTAGVLGGRVAAEKHFDPIGFTALAIASALGGGLLRDVLLAKGTPLALTHPSYLITALAAAAVAFLIDLTRHCPGRVALLLLDALAMSFWAVSGTGRATAAGLGVLPSLLLGVVTGVGGGVIRDVLVGNQPAIFARNDALYATAALAAAGAGQTMNAVGVDGHTATPLSVAIGCGIRLLSLRYGWNLPAAHGKTRRP